VPELRKRLGALDADAVQVQVLGVLVALEELLRAVARLGPHCHAVEGNHVTLGLASRALRVDGAEEVADAHLAA
jgi:hypothetical protein